MKNNNDIKSVAIIGGGPAGMECAAQLKNLGYKCVIIEKDKDLGGHLKYWDRLFPDGKKSEKVLSELVERIKKIKVFYNSTVKDLKHERGKYVLNLSCDTSLFVDSIIVATGFKLFSAERKEEYGYKLYENVITNKDLESYFKKPHSFNIKKPEKIGFVHCVGSRDEKVNNRHCSRVCCVTAVKQAIEMKEMFPDSDIYCFYMDLRMFGRGYEELYYKAQNQYGIRFIRGRVSEVAENIDKKVVVKAEDTLMSKPIKISFDLLVLMAGMENCTDSAKISEISGIEIGIDGFFDHPDELISGNHTSKKGLFITGTATGPKSLPETLNDARSTALAVHHYMENL